MGGRTLELGLAGLSDESTVMLINYVRQGMITEYSSLLLRALDRCLSLKEGSIGNLVVNAVKEVKKELIEWLDVI